MSLVYEALEKAAREKNRFGAPPPAAPLPAAPVPAPVAVPPQRARVAWIGGLSLVAVGAVGALVLLRKPAESPVPLAPPTSIPAPAPEPVPAAPVAPAAVQPPIAAVPTPDNSPAAAARFKLSGIMKYGDEYSAVINGHIVTRDQSVGGAIVKAVAQDQVTLHVDGRDVVLRLF